MLWSPVQDLPCFRPAKPLVEYKRIDVRAERLPCLQQGPCLCLPAGTSPPTGRGGNLLDQERRVSRGNERRAGRCPLKCPYIQVGEVLNVDQRPVIVSR